MVDNIEDTETPRTELRALTAQIVAAYLANHPSALPEVPTLIQAVHQALRGVGQASEVKEAQTPAVTIRRSVTPDYLVCLEDGMHVKMLKRHLRTRHNLAPDEYRTKWGLARNYPMVAPNYAEARSAFARSSGLGRRSEPEREAAPKAEEKSRRGRRKTVK
jgi:predicted transcriptional regulator